MKTYEYKLYEDKKIYTIEADRFETEIKNGVIEYVFYRGKVDVCHLPMFMADGKPKEAEKA